MRYLIVFILLSIGSIVHATARIPNVVVSILPIYSLTTGVMQGVAQPQLLIQPGESEHTYVLKPSQMRLLQQADLVVWVSPTLETFLTKPLHTVNADDKTLTLLSLPHLQRYPLRQGDGWEKHDHDEEDETHDHAQEHAQTNWDPHIWLDPHNAQFIVDAIAQRLIQLDPEHKQQYQDNAYQLQQRLNALDKHLQQQLKPVQHQPYIVFHDAYQYFEKRYQLDPLGAMTLHPEHPSTAGRVSDIRHQAQEKQVVCLFSEPQFEPKIIGAIVEGTSLRTGVLDPLGMDVKEADKAYFSMMQGLSDSLLRCLSQPRG